MRPRGFRRATTWKTVSPIVAAVALATLAAGAWRLLETSADLDADSLRATVAGNTLDGLWGARDEPYKQFVGTDGNTRQVAADGSERAGRWRIEPDGRFCVAWSDGGERCNKARAQEDFFLWIDSENSLGYPFRVLPGAQLTATGSTG